MFDVVIVQPIFNLLMAMYALIPGGDFGVSVVLFTIIVRFLLWPLVKKQLHQAKAMRKIQPELAKLNKKYKNNPQMRAMAMMDVYKKHNIKPMSSILVLLIQLPVLIAIYRVVQIFVLQRSELAKYTYDVMEQWEPVKHLIANPDHFNQNFLGLMDLTKQALSSSGVSIGLLILALVAAVLQYLLSKQMSPSSDNKKRLRDVLMEAGEGKNADQTEVNAIVTRKMMKVMPVFMFLIMISLPGALALYMATSNIAAYIQNAIILKQDGTEMQQIAGEKRSPKSTSKSAASAKKSKAASQRAATATEANITRIKAKD